MPEAVFQYPGGKARIAPWIAGLLPPPGSYKVFVDVFGGAASVTLEVMRRCERAGKKVLFVFNDLDDQIVNFFRVLRDPAMRKQLQEALTWTPYLEAQALHPGCAGQEGYTRKICLPEEQAKRKEW